MLTSYGFASLAFVVLAAVAFADLSAAPNSIFSFDCDHRFDPPKILASEMKGRHFLAALVLEMVDEDPFANPVSELVDDDLFENLVSEILH